MSLKEDWKESGSSLGKALKDLGKATIKTARVGFDKLDDLADGKAKEESSVPEKNVINDGTWTNTGKELGSALSGVGKTIVKSAKEGINKVKESTAKEEDIKNKEE